jgi:cytochrome c peroxidase
MRWPLVVVLVAGCWTSPDLIDGAFTADQWADLQAQLKLPALVPPCTADGIPARQCAAVLDLGTRLFSEPALSCDPLVAATCNPVSCATCHNSAWLVDGRPNNNVSLGTATYTKRNTPTLFNVAFKAQLAPPAAPDVFTWSGGYTSAGGVLELAITKPMNSSDAHVTTEVGLAYAPLYAAAFEPVGEDNSAKIFNNTELAFDVYLRTLVATTSPFDAYVAGNTAALSASAQRGFAIFVGRGTCIECHSGPLFSDLDFHDTGVAQSGANVPAMDPGRGSADQVAADTSKFLTPSLRNVAMTAPYMHDGSIATLADVIAFYRTGGVDAGYGGAKDPRMVPLDLTDDDAKDLEAFLDSLTSAR